VKREGSLSKGSGEGVAVTEVDVKHIELDCLITATREFKGKGLRQFETHITNRHDATNKRRTALEKINHINRLKSRLIRSAELIYSPLLDGSDLARLA